ncbi:PTS sugar transporter subunit IIA [Aminobacter sp. Y103A]|jgi:PTS system galactitol-specific IIA component|uniref:PTS sugar transporter subunit IIA n=1 Tax=Aminobacter TaxID=31988 RepID=UPI0012B019E5|nr:MULTISPECIES: PTS sugar transporter subunit IIA [unclassified Aminobacter]WMC95852.1 PTS sugar transporter subunit IIA [Aminobacter aminovorans]MRX37427.1 PTS sugar transporter subunit IIA [Aminobacter sp. MDW-2]QNH36363.1 PTS sugar transporter subunit IIA [Aminobacter sp. MDW-2]QOF70290.1 PTS sugar transporter subunit IIA [Aminobacter sp. SR38]BBD39418.1 PTS sugar transporter subunit IIA [Aminobacter sp. SS-2016]
MARALMNFLDPQAIALGVEAQDNEAVIRLLAGKLEALGYVRPSYAGAVVKREATMPTGLPLGYALNVAIPHTDPEHVLKPGIALAVLRKPVDFANMEDPDEAVPVGYVFLLAINDKDKQIDMLQEIMDTIQSEAALASLSNARSIEDIGAVLG